MPHSQWIALIFGLLNYIGIQALDVNGQTNKKACGKKECQKILAATLPLKQYPIFWLPQHVSPHLPPIATRRLFDTRSDPIGMRWREVSNHPAWKELDSYDCGENAADRIIGGVNAALGQFPWITRLGYVSEDNDIDWMCGGVLITDRHVVTAAHCTQTNPDDEYKLSFVRLGEYDTRTNPDCQGGTCAPAIQDRAVKKHLIRNHPLFNKPMFHHDISVIELDKRVELNNYVSPVCLPKEEQMADLPIGDMVTVAGWGKMNMSTEERAEVLQYVALPVVEASVCDSLGRGFKLAKSEICAGAQKNKDACGGDSGGPLMKVYDSPEGPKTYLVGVVSFGPTICGIQKPGVYSSASYFLKWILDNIQK